MKSQPKSNLISRFLPLIGAAIFLVSLPVTAQAQPVPDLSVTKVCFNQPLQSVLCTVTVTNLGAVPSVSPLKLTDVVSGAPANALFTGAGGTLPISCSPGAGPVLPIACSANIALLPNQQKTALFSFKLPMGGSFTNCATVTQQNAAGTLLDPNPANNTNICTTVTVPPPSGGGGSITIVTPPPSGACTSQTVVSGLHYPAQSCSQSTPGFLAGMMTSFHFTSKCTAPNTLLGVTNVSCQNAPIPGFTTGSVYQGTACCGTVAPLLGSITIEKDAQPNDAQAFTFTPSVVTIPAFQLDDDPSNSTLANSKTITNLPAGSYTFTEGLVSGWNLASIACTPSSGTTTNITTRAATINLAAGANVTCKFTNVKPPSGTGTLTIVKDAQPNDAQDFAFYAFGPNSGSIMPFLLDDDTGAVGQNNSLSNSKTFTLAPGSYSVKEDFFNPVPVTGWNLTGIACTSSTGMPVGTVDLSVKAFTVNLAAGDNVTCKFTNVKQPSGTGTLTIVKVVQPQNDPQAFTFTSNVPTSIPTFQLDNNPSTGTIPNSKTFTNLPAGVPYTVTENAVSGWTTPSLQCLVAVPGSTTTFTDQLNRTFTVNLAAGANVTCTFTNVKTWPSTAVVNIFNPMMPFGPQTVNISVGGTVTFNNVNSGVPWTITWLSGPSSFGPVPLPTSPSSGTTSPFTIPGTYTYTINGTPSFTLPGTIIVH